MTSQRFSPWRPQLRKVQFTLTCLLLFLGGGCQYLGAIASKFDNPITPAEYKPTREDMLIIVEDSRNPDLVGTLGDRITANVADDLAKHKIDQLIDVRKVIAFHADDREEYQKMSILALAHKFHARQVLYADVKSVTVTAPIGSQTAKGSLTAEVKIIDAQTGETRWPQDANARIVTVETPTLKLNEDGSLEALNDYIVDRSSEKISQLFYDHPEIEETQTEEINNY